MDVTLMRALAAAARAFADEVERALRSDPASATARPEVGSAQCMLEVLRSVAAVNDDPGRGASAEEMRAIARRAGMDPRGMAGYYAAHLLEKRDDGTRWLSQAGRDRLQALSRVVLLDRPTHGQSEPSSPPARR